MPIVELRFLSSGGLATKSNRAGCTQRRGDDTSTKARWSDCVSNVCQLPHSVYEVNT